MKGHFYRRLQVGVADSYAGEQATVAVDTVFLKYC